MATTAAAYRPRHADVALVTPNRARGALALLRQLVGAVVLAGLVLAAAAVWLLHLGLSPVLTGSMRPTYGPGDAIVTRSVPVESVRPGMIAVFVPPGESAPFAHRVISVTGDRHHPVLRTKGDANPAPDAWRATLAGPTVRVVVTSLPKVGYPLTWVHSPRSRAALIGVVGLALTFFFTRRLLRPAP